MAGGKGKQRMKKEGKNPKPSIRAKGKKKKK